MSASSKHFRNGHEQYFRSAIDFCLRKGWRKFAAYFCDLAASHDYRESERSYDVGDNRLGEMYRLRAQGLEREADQYRGLNFR